MSSSVEGISNARSLPTHTLKPTAQDCRAEAFRHLDDPEVANMYTNLSLAITLAGLSAHANTLIDEIRTLQRIIGQKL